MRFRVVINGDVEIRREWPWDRVSRVKDRLKELGFRWNGEYWTGKVYSVSLIRELKDLLELTSEEVEKLMRAILVNSSGGVIGVEDLGSLGSIPNDCVLGEEGGLFIISLSCLIRDFIKNDRNHIGSVSSYEEYVDKAVESIRQLLIGKAVIGDVELALKRAREFALASNKLRELFMRRTEWWTAKLSLDGAELHFLSRELYDKLRGLTIPYYVVDKEGNLNKHDLRLIRKDDIVRAEDKVIIRFPVFIRETIKDMLVKSGYRVSEVPWSPRTIQIPKDEIKLLPFQEKALDSWLKAGKRGTIVVPTGGGKTFIALKALAVTKVPTIILVITEELMNQWYERIMRHLGIKAGRLGGGFDDIREVTVAIYNSAVNKIAEISDKFDMVVFDECLPYDALIVTDRGLMPIGEVVEKRLPVKVLTHKGRFMRITNYFKIPLIKRLVRVTHERGEIVLTEDHLVLTKDGWKQAITLKRGDVVYFYDVQMQNLRERIQDGSSPWGTLRDGSQLRASRDEVSETVATSQRRGSSANKEYGKNEGGEEISFITEIDGRTEGNSVRYGTWGWVSINSTTKGEECKTNGGSCFIPVRVLNVEVLETKKYREVATKVGKEYEVRGLRGRLQISNYLPSRANGDLQGGLRKWAENNNQGVPEYDKYSDSIGSLVPGRWVNKYGEKWLYRNFSSYGGLYLEGEQGAGTVVKDELGPNIQHFTISQLLLPTYTEYEGGEEIPGIDQTDSTGGISREGEFVYDIEVEEDHSFVADGVVVHNCHHVPADTFKEVAFRLRAPFRLALSATPKRSDSNEHLIFLSSGDVVFQADYRDMVEARLVVPVRHFRIYVDLTPEERRDYERAGDNAIVLRNIASVASAKISITKEIVKAEVGIGSKIIVFTQFIRQAEELYKVLKEELGPIITLITSKTSDRDSIFKAFARGAYKVIVATTVLDEGIDVPDADVAIILSGTGSRRQMIQRIGRVVRASDDKVEARIYEVVARNTIEEALSEERHVKGEVLEIECRRYLADEIRRLINHVISSTSLFKSSNP